MLCLARPRLSLAIAVLSLVILLAPGCAADPDDSVVTTTTAEETTTTEAAGPEITVPADLVDLTGQPEVTLTIVDNAFEPNHVKVSAGTNITWVNEGANQHNVTPVGDDSGIIVNPLQADDTYSQTFDEAGEFPYYCSFHGTPTIGQTGFILIEE